MTRQQQKDFDELVAKCQAFHAVQRRNTAPGRAPGTQRRSEMAKAITQETVDKAVAKAVKAETKRCIAAVKSVAVNDLSINTPKKAFAAAVAAIKEPK